MKALQFLLPLLPLASSFSHPGLLVAESDLTRLRGKLSAQLDPWQACWNKLVSTSPANVPYTAQAVSSVDRDNEANADLLWQDAAAAFALALRWKVEGNTSYADAAADILTSWSKELTSIGTNDDQYLVAGLQGHQLANAGELLRDYTPFRENGLDTFRTMMVDVFLAKNIYFLEHREGSEHNVKHFFANWELAQVASVLAIGVLTDNTTTWNFAVDYFKNGTGNGAINNAITNIVEEPGTGNSLGQGQEAGRDQGHSALDFALLGIIGQQAWNQGEDLFAYNNSRILLGAEYFARYNLGYDVPFEPYTNGIVSYSEIGSGSRGNVRWAWEVLYNHYVMIKGQKAPWTTQYLNKTYETFGGFEPGSGSSGSPRVSGNYDTLGWGTLLYHLNESDVASIRGSSTTSSVVHKSSTHEASVVKVQEATTSISGSSVFSSGSATTISASTGRPELTTSTATNSDFLPVSATTAPASTLKPHSDQHTHIHHHHNHHHDHISDSQGSGSCPILPKNS
ncbi:exopolysaccharide inner membrane protein [Penicillium brasilianum]|uniref:Exopolysaccharide inner membrane protein n=1 Tax=Penicillium brasilianum TaxID=104259 RepID=A0A1S9RL66_PENBI|nr:exopolysaccharide inner membrane protein [Penicillium brasilianum]